MDEPTPKRRIAALNDAFRQAAGTPSDDCHGGRCVMTAGIAALPAITIQQIWQRARAFNDFTPDVPCGEHGFGVIEHDEAGKVFWKMDYYDALRRNRRCRPTHTAAHTLEPTSGVRAVFCQGCLRSIASARQREDPVAATVVRYVRIETRSARSAL
jgi:hypothetical protein